MKRLCGSSQIFLGDCDKSAERLERITQLEKERDGLAEQLSRIRDMFKDIKHEVLQNLSGTKEEEESAYWESQEHKLLAFSVAHAIASANRVENILDDYMSLPPSHHEQVAVALRKVAEATEKLAEIFDPNKQAIYNFARDDWNRATVALAELRKLEKSDGN